MTDIQFDIAIIGGGIAGLWLLNRLRQAGFSAILMESHTLGGGQTHKSQGIIHGGMKYALTGQLTGAAKTIASMPAIWKACLEGRGEIDLSKATIIAKKQILWSTGTLLSNIASVAANLALKSDTHLIDQKDYPALFQNSAFQGKIYSLDEIVIDVESVLRALREPYKNHIIKINPLVAPDIMSDEKNNIVSLHIQSNNKKAALKAQQFIFVAGSGNAILSETFPSINMQRRSLHMVIMKHDYDAPLYGHSLGLSSLPRITISTHRAHDGKTIWYMGGQLAEEGVSRTSEEQIAATQKELKILFPWLDFSNASFASFHIDRAEGWQPDEKRPDSCTIRSIGNVIAAWPTKLAFAPLLSEKIMQSLTIKPLYHDTMALQDWPRPAIAQPIWDELLP